MSLCYICYMESPVSSEEAKLFRKGKRLKVKNEEYLVYTVNRRLERARSFYKVIKDPATSDVERETIKIYNLNLPKLFIKMIEESPNIDSDYFWAAIDEVLDVYQSALPITKISLAKVINKIRKANNPNTSIADLANLAKSKSWLVRYCVAINQRTPLAGLKRLLGDPSFIVQSAVFENKNMPTSELAGLEETFDLTTEAEIALRTGRLHSEWTL